MSKLISHISRLSVSEFVELLRAVYMAGAGSFDPTDGEDMKDPTDGDLIGLMVDQLGGASVLDDSNAQISAAAIQKEISTVLHELEDGGRLSMTAGPMGHDLSEAFSTYVYQLLKNDS